MIESHFYYTYVHQYESHECMDYCGLKLISCRKTASYTSRCVGLGPFTKLAKKERFIRHTESYSMWVICRLYFIGIEIIYQFVYVYWFEAITKIYNQFQKKENKNTKVRNHIHTFGKITWNEMYFWIYYCFIYVYKV